MLSIKVTHDERGTEQRLESTIPQGSTTGDSQRRRQHAMIRVKAFATLWSPDENANLDIFDNCGSGASFVKACGSTDNVSCCRYQTTDLRIEDGFRLIMTVTPALFRRDRLRSSSGNEREFDDEPGEDIEAIHSSNTDQTKDTSSRIWFHLKLVDPGQCISCLWSLEKRPWSSPKWVVRARRSMFFLPTEWMSRGEFRLLRSRVLVRVTSLLPTDFVRALARINRAIRVE